MMGDLIGQFLHPKVNVVSVNTRHRLEIGRESPLKHLEKEYLSAHRE